MLQFEELRGYLMSNYPLHTEEFYLSIFLSALRADIQQALYIYKPSSLQEAIDNAKEQEIFINMLEKRSKPYTRSTTSYFSKGPSEEISSKSTSNYCSIVSHFQRYSVEKEVI